MITIILAILAVWLLTLEVRQHGVKQMIADTKDIIDQAVAKVRGLD